MRGPVRAWRITSGHANLITTTLKLGNPHAIYAGAPVKAIVYWLPGAAGPLQQARCTSLNQITSLDSALQSYKERSTVG
jgi:hypothetical protein